MRARQRVVLLSSHWRRHSATDCPHVVRHRARAWGAWSMKSGSLFNRHTDLASDAGSICSGSSRPMGRERTLNVSLASSATYSASSISLPPIHVRGWRRTSHTTISGRPRSIFAASTLLSVSGRSRLQTPVERSTLPSAAAATKRASRGSEPAHRATRLPAENTRLTPSDTTPHRGPRCRRISTRPIVHRFNAPMNSHS